MPTTAEPRLMRGTLATAAGVSLLCSAVGLALVWMVASQYARYGLPTAWYAGALAPALAAGGMAGLLLVLWRGAEARPLFAGDRFGNRPRKRLPYEDRLRTHVVTLRSRILETLATAPFFAAVALLRLVAPDEVSVQGTGDALLGAFFASMHVWGVASGVLYLRVRARLPRVTPADEPRTPSGPP